jgi:hypothetical protein
MKRHQTRTEGPQVAYGTKKLFGAEPPERAVLRAVEVMERALRFIAGHRHHPEPWGNFGDCELHMVKIAGGALAAAERALARGEG